MFDESVEEKTKEIIDAPIEKPAPRLRADNSCQAVGQRIRQMRKRQKITQKELAEKLGVTKPMISNLEKGYSQRYNLRFLSNLCRELNTTLDMLAFGTPVEVDNAIWFVDQLPEKSKRILAAYLNQQIGD